MTIPHFYMIHFGPNARVVDRRSADRREGVVEELAAVSKGVIAYVTWGEERPNSVGVWVPVREAVAVGCLKTSP